MPSGQEEVCNGVGAYLLSPWNEVAQCDQAQSWTPVEAAKPVLTPPKSGRVLKPGLDFKPLHATLLVDHGVEAPIPSFA